MTFSALFRPLPFTAHLCEPCSFFDKRGAQADRCKYFDIRSIAANPWCHFKGFGNMVGAQEAAIWLTLYLLAAVP